MTILIVVYCGGKRILKLYEFTGIILSVQCSRLHVCFIISHRRPNRMLALNTEDKHLQININGRTQPLNNASLWCSLIGILASTPTVVVERSHKGIPLKNFGLRIDSPLQFYAC